jgi:hypothetical protein
MLFPTARVRRRVITSTAVVTMVLVCALLVQLGKQDRLAPSVRVTFLRSARGNAQPAGIQSGTVSSPNTAAEYEVENRGTSAVTLKEEIVILCRLRGFPDDDGTEIPATVLKGDFGVLKPGCSRRFVVQFQTPGQTGSSNGVQIPVQWDSRALFQTRAGRKQAFLNWLSAKGAADLLPKGFFSSPAHGSYRFLSRWQELDGGDKPETLGDR